MQAWLFSAIKNKEYKDDEEYTNDVFSFLSFVTIMAVAFLIIVINPLFKIYASKEFFKVGYMLLFY